MTLTLSRFRLLFTSLLLVFVCLFNGAERAGAPYQAEDPANIKLNVAVVSDLHASGNVSQERNVVLERTFAGVAKSKTKLDALVLPGDLANVPTADEYRCLAAILKRYNKADDLIPAIGNHDSWGDPADYYTFFSLVGIPLEHPYWTKTVNGYPFIVLGTEESMNDRAFISDTQLAWLDEQLAAAEQNGKLAFVVCHQVIDHTNNVDNWWYYDGSIGEQSNAVRDVIRSHTDRGLTVLFISGHLHRCFCADSLEQPWPNIYCLNVPTVQQNTQVAGSREEPGEGCTIEVYADRILIRPRNFISGECPADTYTIPIN